MRVTVTGGSIDFDAIRRTVDLRRTVELELGPPLKGGRWPCPVHDGEHPNFSVHGDRWRCWVCGAHGDVIDFIAAVDGCSVAEAAAKLDPSSSFRRESQPRPRRAVRPLANLPKAAPVWRDAAWRSAVDAIVRQAEETLWSPEGRSALVWLRARGLNDATISRFRLGFLPCPVRSDPVEALGRDDRGDVRRVWASRGITIPWVRPEGWYDAGDGDCPDRWVGVNVRRLADGDVNAPLPDRFAKYKALAGSERGHGYPWPEASMPGEPAVVCEGEFDSLVGWQQAGWVGNVVSFGGAGQSNLHPDARAFLAACPDWLLLFDHDDAGDGAAREMARRNPGRCRRLFLPGGVNDLNDLHRGGSVLGWLRSEWGRFGWPWPLVGGAAA